MGILAASVITILGSFWAFQRGAPDFAVFYKAWTLVIQGQGMDLYHTGPDRYLYAPGFAWVFAPLALLPLKAALLLWCILKVWVLYYVIRVFSRWLDCPLGTAAWGLVLFARPLLIDLQYGQVNALLLGGSVWALDVLFSPSQTMRIGRKLAWSGLAFVAVTKLYALPLLILPWLNRKRDWISYRAAGAVGVGITLLIPLMSVSPSQGIGLLDDWRHALISRGLPMESHNQSFIALLNHYFSGNPTWVISLYQHTQNGWAWLSESTIQKVSILWSVVAVLFIGVCLNKIKNGRYNRLTAQWSAVLIGAIFLPSHLIWKPHFVLGIPLGICAIDAARRSRAMKTLAITVFAAINLTSFDFIGYRLAAKFESASVLLLSQLALLAGMMIILTSQRDQQNQNPIKSNQAVVM